MTKILLACAEGMSTSLLMNKMKDYAKQKGLSDITVEATNVSGLDSKMASDKPNILLLGPQVRYMQNQLQNSLDIPVDVIDMMDYGMMKGDKVLDKALSDLKK